jgi:hypothetical protein
MTIRSIVLAVRFVAVLFGVCRIRTRRPALEAADAPSKAARSAAAHAV